MASKVSAIIQSALEQGVSLDELREELLERSLAAGGWGDREFNDTWSLRVRPWEQAIPEQTLPSPGASGGGDAPLAALPRYEDLGPLGTGGMGEVRRVRDRLLGRSLALKMLHAPALARPNLVARFREEAQATAQLQHPGIVPIHDLGVLPDGRVWFTMKEVTGQTLSRVVAEVHAVSRRRWQSTPSGWTLRRLVDGLRRVCEAVAYAHGRGVVHRDLKPENVMVGAHGEVLVLDWGLAKILGRSDGEELADAADLVWTDRSRGDAHATRAGAVAGTPAYMAPEQARGELSRVGVSSDVYALGAMLYEILSGRPPYRGTDGHEILQAVLAGPPPPLRSARARRERLVDPASPDAAPAAPVPLVLACKKAMARDPEGRFPSAAAFAAELAAWLDGARRREAALAIVAAAADQQPRARALRIEAAALRAEAEVLLRGVASWRPEGDKLAGWAKEDEAADLERQAELASLQEQQLLQGSLVHAPELPEAHAALAHRYRAAHAAAEAARQDTGRSEFLLRQHLQALPDDHPDRVAHLTYLRGDGALSLVTDPPGAEVLLHRYVSEGRRLVPRFVKRLGTTPLRRIPLPRGSYLCVLRHPERVDARYPVWIGRGEHWDGVPPGASQPEPIRLFRPDELGPDDCFMPPGWFWSGGDPDAPNSLPRRWLWLGGRVVRRFPVTNTEYLVFLGDLVTQGRTEDAIRYAPRERAGSVTETGNLIYGFEDGRFWLRPDGEGDVWEPDWPVIMVDWHGASAFARWTAARTGQPWQLPGELAWEKAARGVDGRFHPWGDAFDPSRACMRNSHPGRPLPQVVDSFPLDESAYGVRGMAGNVRDWCAEVYTVEGPPIDGARAPDAAAVPVCSVGAQGGANFRVQRGGQWNGNPTRQRCAARSRGASTIRGYTNGFRLMRPIH